MGRPYSNLVTAIGQNQENKAEWYLFDLNIDPKELENLDEGELKARLAEYPKPVRRLKTNAAPMLFPAYDAPECCKGRELGDEELENRAEYLQNDKDLCQRLISAFESERKDFPVSPHVEKKIYDAFFDRADEALMETFHQAPWERRLAVIERFKDDRLKIIGRHLIYLERPHLLDEATKRAHDLTTAKRLLGQCEDVTWLTLPEALGQLKKMMTDAIGNDLANLHEHEIFLVERHEQAALNVGLA